MRADYLMLSYERPLRDGHAEGYDEIALSRVFHANGAALIERLGFS